MTGTNVSLQQWIALAYQVHDFQMSGPNWLGSQRFDIQAEGVEWATKANRPVILRNLLLERFKLAVHSETKELPCLVAKNGLSCNQ